MRRGRDGTIAHWKEEEGENQSLTQQGTPAVNLEVVTETHYSQDGQGQQVKSTGKMRW